MIPSASSVLKKWGRWVELCTTVGLGPGWKWCGWGGSFGAPTKKWPSPPLYHPWNKMLPERKSHACSHAHNLQRQFDPFWSFIVPAECGDSKLQTLMIPSASSVLTKWGRWVELCTPYLILLIDASRKDEMKLQAFSVTSVFDKSKDGPHHVIGGHWDLCLCRHTRKPDSWIANVLACKVEFQQIQSDITTCSPAYEWKPHSIIVTKLRYAFSLDPNSSSS